MTAKIPELSLVLLIGASGAGKSTFARKHFLATEVLSSDLCCAMVSDDVTNLEATDDAFAVLHYIAAKRMARGRLTVIDATNVTSLARRSLIALARTHHFLITAIVLNMSEAVCIAHNASRADRTVERRVIQRQIRQLRESLPKLRREGIHQVIRLESTEDIAQFSWARQPLWNNRAEEHGPFDIIGDVHGCFDELNALIEKLGYECSQDVAGIYQISHPQGRKLVFLGDLVDRGPGIASVLRLVMDGVRAGTALCVMGNHEWKLLRKLKGQRVTVSHGLQDSLDQLEQEGAEFRDRVQGFLNGLVSHYVLDEGRLVVVHAGLPQTMQGRGSAQVREFALYGETTGETDEFGLPIRYNWATDYRGSAMVVYGHTPVPRVEWLNHTVNLDTGCVFGGRLTALRYPENEFVEVPAGRVYVDPVRPIWDTTPSKLSAQHEQDEILDLEDLLGKRRVDTTLMGPIVIPEEGAGDALLVLSRFAIDPKWLIYVPPTMSPAKTSDRPGTLEHPDEAFAYFRKQGVNEVVCEQKHMGSRAIIVVCREKGVAKRRFGVLQASLGSVYTRTGRRFFEDNHLETEVLERVRNAASTARLFDLLDTDWLLLDTEIMPWSLKARGLLEHQYAPTGRAGSMSLRASCRILEEANARGLDVMTLQSTYTNRYRNVEKYIEAYRHYVWTVRSIADIKIAPFHLLATEGAIHAQQDHLWHLEQVRLLAEADPNLIQVTPFVRVLLEDAESVSTGVNWWEQLTDAGQEGMVVKPLQFMVRSPNGHLAQPAIKVRGREYLRVIYGPDYTDEDNLVRLRQRGLSRKRAAALREFALGIEGLTRFVAREPLRRVHECVHAVLALESQPIDPRL